MRVHAKVEFCDAFAQKVQSLNKTLACNVMI